ncbi:MAG: electron transfer flavoprotein subunit beta/FixA family protein [Syntrophaceae bacterium]
MRIVVCIKQVPDPEGPRDAYFINTANATVEPRGIPPVLSLFDENALEAALRIRDQIPQGSVSVLSIGKRIPNAVMLKALAAGADSLVKVEDESLDASGLDSYITAQVLAAALSKLGFDLIVVGRQAADWNDGQVGIGIARLLDLPSVTLVRSVHLSGHDMEIERVLPQGYEIVRTALPALIMVGGEAGELRYPSMIQRREAKNKPITTWNLIDIGLTTLPAKRVIRQRLFAPELKDRACRMVDGASLAEAGRNLAERLHSDRVV